MQIPYSWLREHVPTAPADPAAAAELLTVSGTIVEAIHPTGVENPASGGGEAFRVGRVIEFAQHPDADRLRLVQVDVGEGAPRQIVCGASNFAVGDTVAVVLPGGRMPDGMEIKEAQLRGVDSRGMMISERELGLSTEHDGIMILPADWTPGDSLHERIGIGDSILEFEITGNRPDCLGVLGVARELAVATGQEFLDADSTDVEATAPGDVSDHVRVTLDAPDLCARYMARALVGVTVAPSPLWLKARLARAGMRAINNVVDITNYVMLLTGQPLHAFDAEQVRGGHIVVRRAHEDEQVTTLDDVTRTLDPEVLVIADDERIAVIAGVMGAADVEVHAGTTRLILEAATFSGLNVQSTSRKLGLRSESSSRFEKGLDPHAPARALRIASELLVRVCGAKLVPGTVDVVAGGQLAVTPVIELPRDLPERILGIQIQDADVRTTLEGLGFGTTSHEHGWRVEVPHVRMHDVTRPIDVVEELGRFRLDQVPSLLPSIRTGGAMLTRSQRLRRLVEDTAAGMGLTEVVTYGLVAPGSGELLGHEEADVVRLANPMTSDHAELRTGMLPSHLEVARRNVAAGATDIALFEIGRTFSTAPIGTVGDDGLPRYANERDALGVLVTGIVAGARWDLPGIPADFPAVAGIVESLLRATGVESRLAPLPNAPTWLHPGQAAEVRTTADGSLLGWVAAVHPRFATEQGVDHDVYAAHLDLAAVDAARDIRPRYAPFSEFPPILEDIAVVLSDDIAGADVLRTARDAGGELLDSIEVFDRYVGAPIESGHHSLALRLEFRAHDRTLTDEEIVGVRTGIVTALTAQHGAVLRG